MTNSNGPAASIGMTPNYVSSVYDATAHQNLNCEFMTTSAQTTCPTGAMSVDYGAQFQYEDSTTGHEFLPTETVDPQQNELDYCYYESSEDCTGYSGPSGALAYQTVPADSYATISTFGYNTNGTPDIYGNGVGDYWSYGYDSSGNLTSLEPDGSGTQSTALNTVNVAPDDESRPSVITDGNGNTETFTYDNLDRVTKIVYSSGPTINYTYDADGNLTKRVDPTGTTNYTIDALNRVTQESLPGIEDQHLRL